MREPTHNHTVPSQLAHIARAQLPHLRRNAVLFHERFLKIDFKNKNHQLSFPHARPSLLW
jgi:hypothetical protein